MRWSRLFDDLEAQLAAVEQAELAGEVAEHTRAARASVGLLERLTQATGSSIRLGVHGLGDVEGELEEVATQWVMVSRAQVRGGVQQLVVATSAILTVGGLGARSQPLGEGARRRLDLGQALRALSRDRAVLRLHDISGGVVAGTIDRVGRDHLDVSTHPTDLPRRPAAVHGAVVIPFDALAAVSHRPAGTLA